jgi:triacylglycerol lipase
LTGMVQQLSERVEQICQETRSEQIDIVAHSLGGIVSRYYMSLGEGRGRVKHLVTLGTPHRGTDLSVLLKGVYFGALDSDLKSGSYLINLLTETSLPADSTLTSIYAQHDWTVWPRGNCAVEGLPQHAFHNIQVDNMGHMSLLYSSEVVELTMKFMTVRLIKA